MHLYTLPIHSCKRELQNSGIPATLQKFFSNGDIVRCSNVHKGPSGFPSPPARIAAEILWTIRINL